MTCWRRYPTPTTIPLLCGNCQIDSGDTCNDCNTEDNDPCPSGCAIDECTPVEGSSWPVRVTFTPPEGANIGDITVLLIYPEGKVEIPGPSIPAGVITNAPAGAFSVPLDLGHALGEIVALSGTIPPGTLFHVNFRRCEGAADHGVEEFKCRVVVATDPLADPVSGVTCAATNLSTYLQLSGKKLCSSGTCRKCS